MTRGFTLIEVVISMGLMLVIVAALAAGAQAAYRAVAIQRAEAQKVREAIVEGRRLVDEIRCNVKCGERWRFDLGEFQACAAACD